MSLTDVLLGSKLAELKYYATEPEAIEAFADAFTSFFANVTSPAPVMLSSLDSAKQAMKQAMAKCDIEQAFVGDGTKTRFEVGGKVGAVTVNGIAVDCMEKETGDPNATGLSLRVIEFTDAPPVAAKITASITGAGLSTDAPNAIQRGITAFWLFACADAKKIWPKVALSATPPPGLMGLAAAMRIALASNLTKFPNLDKYTAWATIAANIFPCMRGAIATVPPPTGFQPII